MPMKAELTENGFDELLTSSDVDAAVKSEGTTLVMINSVCGCAAGSARPGVVMAVNNTAKKPAHLATSFAGFDVDAIKQLRAHLMPYPPSSPAIALFKDGELVHFVERHQIEGRPAQVIANNLIAAFEQYC
jgi:putative YphP/YqiW family bacilliredoxin